LEEITALVRDAVGYVEERGDRVSVVNLEFSAPPADPEEPGVPWGELIRYALIALAILFAYYALIRPFLKPAPTPTPTPTPPPPPPPSEPKPGTPEDPVPEPKDPEEEKRKRYQELLQHAEKFATEKPEETALLLRAWLNDKDQQSA
ncbi:MAG: flagellar M-ring protein FliF C-terminal domain-containing protein, partial [Steroidobacteraceae bacterium]